MFRTSERSDWTTMITALVQVAEPADNYDPATIALFALFIVALIVTAGLLLRDLLHHEPEHIPYSSSWLPRDPGDEERPPASAASHFPAGYPRTDAASPSGPTDRQQPAWFRQVMTTQQGDIAEGLGRSVDQLIEAGNRGDIRGGFSVHTPEYVARQQAAMALDPAALERMMRAAPRPVEHPVSVSSISEITVDPPNRATALVSYAADGDPPPPERFHFIYDQATGVWLIDNIERASS